jgi:hypothetical protein
VPEDGREDAVRIARIDDDRRNLLPPAQAEVGPVRAGVGGLVDAVSRGEIGALEPFAAADVQDVGVGGSDGDRADGAGRLVVEDRAPHPAEVGALPHAAIVDADVEKVGLAWHANSADGAHAAMGPDHAPAHEGEGRRVDLLSR